MKRAHFFPAFFFFSTAAFSPVSAQDVAVISQPGTSDFSASQAAPTTKLSNVFLAEPVTEEGFATVRIADADGQAIYRGMLPVQIGVQSLNLSQISIPVNGRYTLRVVYPGGTLMKELGDPLSLPPANETDAVAGR